MRTLSFLTLSSSCSINLTFFLCFSSSFLHFSIYLRSSAMLAASFSPRSVKSVFCLTSPLYEFFSVLYSALIFDSYQYKSPIFFPFIDSYNFLWAGSPFLFFPLLLPSLVLDALLCEFVPWFGIFLCDYLFDIFLYLWLPLTYGLMALICFD